LPKQSFGVRTALWGSAQTITPNQRRIQFHLPFLQTLVPLPAQVQASTLSHLRAPLYGQTYITLTVQVFWRLKDPRLFTQHKVQDTLMNFLSTQSLHVLQTTFQKYSTAQLMNLGWDPLLNNLQESLQEPLKKSGIEIYTPILSNIQLPKSEWQLLDLRIQKLAEFQNHLRLMGTTTDSLLVYQEKQKSLAEKVHVLQTQTRTLLEDAHIQSAQIVAPALKGNSELYRFIKYHHTYAQTLNAHSSLVIDKQSDYSHYLQSVYPPQKTKEE